jgi:hypothetical protein
MALTSPQKDDPKGSHLHPLMRIATDLKVCRYIGGVGAKRGQKMSSVDISIRAGFGQVHAPA